ncbi:MAG: hypothetical protein R8K20_07680 [Gallionellaceae bacterium]
MFIVIVSLSIFVILLLLFAIGYSHAETAVLATAGSVQNFAERKRLIASNNRPLSVKLPLFRGIDFSCLDIDKGAIKWGKADGSSMKPLGINNGDYFAYTKSDFSIKKELKEGDVLLLRIDVENTSKGEPTPDKGGYKLRMLVEFDEDMNNLRTASFNDSGKLIVSQRMHRTDTIIGLVTHVAS